MIGRVFGCGRVWSRNSRTETSALHWLLHAGAKTGRKNDGLDHAGMQARIEALAADSGGSIVLRAFDPAAPRARLQGAIDTDGIDVPRSSSWRVRPTVAMILISAGMMVGEAVRSSGSSGSWLPSATSRALSRTRPSWSGAFFVKIVFVWMIGTSESRSP